MLNLVTRLFIIGLVIMTFAACGADDGNDAAAPMQFVTPTPGPSPTPTSVGPTIVVADIQDQEAARFNGQIISVLLFAAGTGAILLLLSYFGTNWFALLVSCGVIVAIIYFNYFSKLSSVIGTGEPGLILPQEASVSVFLFGVLFGGVVHLARCFGGFFGNKDGEVRFKRSRDPETGRVRLQAAGFLEEDRYSVNQRLGMKKELLLLGYDSFRADEIIKVIRSSNSRNLDRDLRKKGLKDFHIKQVRGLLYPSISNGDVRYLDDGNY
jgi:hypothetical protein